MNPFPKPIPALFSRPNPRRPDENLEAEPVAIIATTDFEFMAVTRENRILIEGHAGFEIIRDDGINEAIWAALEGTLGS